MPEEDGSVDYGIGTSTYKLKSLDKFSSFIRDNFVLPFRPKEPPVYYHRKFARVPTVDECEVDDVVCKYEAQEQFMRDRRVDLAKLRILRRRFTECNLYWGNAKREQCDKERRDFEGNQLNFFLKYGDVDRQADPYELYMKQKHRMVWVRRRQEAGDINASYSD